MSDCVVDLEGVEKEYGPATARLPVLKGVDLSIGRGEFCGIVGASGSGKTTLMNILGCLDRPTRGRYRLSDEDVSSLDDARLSRVRNQRIGFVFQSFNLIAQLTVVENVEVPLFYGHVPRRDRRKRCMALLEAVGLSHRLKHHPTQLSGGECQRVAVARALVNEPSLLLADEPTGNLDSKNGVEVMRLFGELHAQGRTIVLVTHNPEIAATLPRVIEMRDGRVVGEHLAAASATVEAVP
jgi:putative ABC transport system ATP-binding protein